MYHISSLESELEIKWIASMTEKRIFSSEEIDTIKFLNSEGCRLEIIAIRLQCSLEELKPIAKQLNIKTSEVDPTIFLKKDNYTTRKNVNTELEDDLILKACILGWTWEKIAKELNWSRDRTVERGRRLNARDKAAEVHRLNPVEEVSVEKIYGQVNLESKRFTALPAGHPRTWDLISKGMPNPFNTKKFEEFIPQVKIVKKTIPFNKFSLCFE